MWPPARPGLIYLNLLTIYRNPFNPERYRLLYPATVIFLGLATVAGCHFGLSWGRSPSDVPASAVTVLAVGFIIVPFVLFVGVGGALYLLVRLLVSSAQRGGGSTNGSSSIATFARQRVMRHGTAYLVLHGIQLAAAVALLLTILFNTPPAEPTPDADADADAEPVRADARPLCNRAAVSAPSHRDPIPPPGVGPQSATRARPLYAVAHAGGYHLRAARRILRRMAHH